MCERKERKVGAFEAGDVSADEIYKFMTAHWHHHNQLAWSKLNVLLALEAAVLAGAYTIKIDAHVSACALVLVGSIVAVILYLLMLRDWEVRDYYAVKLDPVHDPLHIRMIPTSKGPLSQGRSLLILLITALVVVNIWTICLLNCCTK